MAGQTVNSVTSALTGELTSRVFSGLIQRYGKDGAIREKLQRLEMLLIKIHSAIEASEMRTIENSWLLRWRDQLKEAASQGDEVLASLRQRVKDAQDNSNTDANQQQGEAASSSAATPAAAVGVQSCTRNSLAGIVQKMMLWSVDDEMKRLNKTLGRLEELSPDIGEFIKLLHLEALPKVNQTSYSTSLSTKVHGPTAEMMKTRKKQRVKDYAAHTNPSLEPPKEGSMELLPPPLYSSVYVYSGHLPAPSFDLEYDLAVLLKEQQFRLLQDRLETAFTEICKAVELADCSDLEDLDWLASWAGILREAMEQGSDVLASTSACKIVNAEDNKESMMEFDQVKDELGSFVHRLEVLAIDVEFFNKLVYLSRAC